MHGTRNQSGGGGGGGGLFIAKQGLKSSCLYKMTSEWLQIKQEIKAVFLFF